MPAMPYSRYIVGSLPWYGVLIVIGMALAILYLSTEEKRLSLPKDTATDLALWVIPLGVIGARIYYVIFAWDTFAAQPLSALKIWEGGLAIYGGVIGGVLAIVLFARRRKLSAPLLMDAIVPGLALAQAIGRWGNYFNMEAYGAAITDPAWQFFPAGVLIPGSGGPVWHMATFFYESMWNLLAFAVLLRVRKRVRRTGDVACWYFLFYGAGRFVIEGLRTDSLMSGSLRVSQLLSAALGLIVLGYFFWRARRKKAAWIALAAEAAVTALLLLLAPPAVWRNILLSLSALLSGAVLYTLVRPEE